ncbi:hypothetical protein HY546_01285 [archaeon]|nr:hypothetical protein [archaeon]
MSKRWRRNKTNQIQPYTIEHLRDMLATSRNALLASDSFHRTERASGVIQAGALRRIASGAGLSEKDAAIAILTLGFTLRRVGGGAASFKDRRTIKAPARRIDEALLAVFGMEKARLIIDNGISATMAHHNIPPSDFGKFRNISHLPPPARITFLRETVKQIKTALTEKVALTEKAKK